MSRFECMYLSVSPSRPPTQCYLGYAYACSQDPPPPPFSESPVCKVNTSRLLFFFIRAFFSTPPPLSAKVRCVKSIRVDLVLLLRAGEFGNTHGIPPFTGWGEGGVPLQKTKKDRERLRKFERNLERPRETERDRETSRKIERDQERLREIKGERMS